jgi:hypothetical protein
MAQRPVTLADIVRGHVSLQIEGSTGCIPGWVPALQTSGQIVGWLHWPGFPIASPAALGRNSQAFRAAVRRYADGNQIPWVVFRKGDRKLEVIRPYLWPIPAAAVPRDDRPDAFLGHRAGRCC